MKFKDRLDAAQHLAVRLGHLRGKDPLVLAIPRGAVPMGRVLAEALYGDLDVVLVRKLRAPGNPELAIGAVDEEGVVALNELAEVLRVGTQFVERAAEDELAVIRNRRERLAGHFAVDPRDRTVVIVDDGLATGSTMLAAIGALRRRGPRRVIVAVPVASPEALERVRHAADEVVCLDAPSEFSSVGRFYEDFAPVLDTDVVEILRGFREGRLRREAAIPAGLDEIRGDLVVPPHAKAIVVFAHGSGSSRRSPRNRFVAEALHRRGIATLLVDLLTPEEDAGRRECRFDIELLTRRLLAATQWLRGRTATARLPMGYFGASTGAACALEAAAQLGDEVGAVVSRGGRPDLALEALPHVFAPTLLVVGGEDQAVIGLNQLAYARLATHVKRLEIVPGATHLFEEPGALERVAESAARWFEAHLVRRVRAVAQVPVH
jgi:predicted phosphoribosyltransferase/predicted alpha/beta-hydrolase family hydrolase